MMAVELELRYVVLTVVVEAVVLPKKAMMTLLMVEVEVAQEVLMSAMLRRPRRG
jgi:hypothetical protein